MRVPFTSEQFLAVFTRFNEAIWPAQLVAHALGAAVLWLAVRGGSRAGHGVGALLAGAWIFVGAAYHLAFFSEVTPAAYVFGSGFLLEGVLLGLAAWRDRLTFRFTGSSRNLFGLALVAYAAVLYPVLGVAAGHGYPRTPMFGVTPCPTTIFTFGVLLLAEAVPPSLLAIPFLWSLVGLSAAIQLGMKEDLGLVVAGLAATPWLLACRPGRAGGPGGRWRTARSLSRP